MLARKYRPATFDDLIGQDAMVRTVSNAFETGRIPQAWILTGVRGVGKTTTARILARALNYQLPDGSITGPTIAMPVLGVHCQAIMESRHIDVLEMDAASHNGVDDVRQINDAVRYAPVSARYKVYILDEVHMLSTAAFNALLKTLEEPPPHAKFIFATTEIRKVPITVLSRCQRFDLRRVEAGLLVEHLGKHRRKGKCLGRAGGAGADRARGRRLGARFAFAVRSGDRACRGPGAADRCAADARVWPTARAWSICSRRCCAATSPPRSSELRDQYDSGADPAVILSDLAEFTHFVTRVKIVPSVADDLSLAEAGARARRTFAAALSMRVLSRTWQMLLKGIAEVQAAGRPVAAAEMVLVRIAYAADLPTPDEVDPLARERFGHSAVARPQGNGKWRQWRECAMPHASGSAAPRYDAPRGAPRAALSPAASPVARAADAAPETRGLADRHASRIWSRSQPTSATCRSRPRSNATCGWCIARTASSKSRSSRAPTKRWSTNCRASSRPGPAANGWWSFRGRAARRR